MDLMWILLRGAITREEYWDWYLGLWGKPTKNKGPQRGQKVWGAIPSKECEIDLRIRDQFME